MELPLKTELGRNRAELYREGQRVVVTGRRTWYQGDPAVYVTEPDQVQILAGATAGLALRSNGR